MRFTFYVLFILTSVTTYSQVINYNPYQNPIILQHYTTQELQLTEQTDSVKFNALSYYYTRSFVFKTKPCNCVPVDITTFDISQYEYLRHKSKPVIRHFEKYGFEVLFIPIDELAYKLPIHFTK